MYDPCLPTPVEIIHGATRRIRRHNPVFRVLGRRMAVPRAPRIIADACPKTSKTLWLPRRVTTAVSQLASPPLLTAVGITVVGISAFPVATIIQRMSTSGDPSSLKPPTGFGGGLPTSVPEPGTAVILAVAMAVVLISSWIHGSHAFRVERDSEITGRSMRLRYLPRRSNVTPDHVPAESRKFLGHLRWRRVMRPDSPVFGREAERDRHLEIIQGAHLSVEPG